MLISTPRRGSRLPARRSPFIATTLTLFAVGELEACLHAQDLRPVGPGYLVPNRVCYDSLRQRHVGLDYTGRTWELDGASWSVRPDRTAFPQASGLTPVFASSLRRSLVVAPDAQLASMVTWGFDGFEWSQLAAANAPGGRTDANFVWDPIHGCLVMFGGDSTGLPGPLDETWTFDGSVWVQHSPIVTPPARSFAAFAADPVRQRVVMFGGYSSLLGPLGDTWEWDGTNWQQQFTATTPAARNHAAMAYDPARVRCVMYGGFGPSLGSPTEIWEYDGVDWSQVVSAGAQPGWRMAHSMAFDDRLAEVVVIGGYEGTYPTTSAASTSWSWNGSRWQQQAVLGDVPSPRYGTNLATEFGFADCILFGGAGLQSMLADTWRWDGTGWTELPVPGPPARANAASCSAPSGVWMFGGAGGGSSIQYYGDTWQWNGSAWSQLAATGPSPRANTDMAYDAMRGVAVLFGGYAGIPRGDTWTFDGASWQQRTPANAPSPRFGHALAYDHSSGLIVLFGGLDANLQPLTDTWTWDGINWSQRSPAVSPTGTGYCAIQFDLLRQRLVLLTQQTFGGLVSAWTFDGVTWSPVPLSVPRSSPYRPQLAVAPGGRGVVGYLSSAMHQLSTQQAEVETYGGVCGVGAPQLSARTWPTLGASFGLDCIDNDPNSLVAFVGAFTRANIPLGSCHLLVTPGLVTIAQMSNAAGFAQHPMPLPPWPGLLGLELCWQAASLRSSSPDGFVVSRGLALTIGD